MAETVVDRPAAAGPLSPGRLRVALIAALTVAALLPVLSIRRMPTPFADVQLYASIARARQLYGVGVPTIIWNSPLAVDHIPFYGPVYFDLAALALRMFGVSLWSFRLVSLLGAGVYALATALLARQFTGSRNRVLLAALLALLTPEVNLGAASGAMHMLAVGLEVLALAAFVTNVDRGRGVEWGVMAGLCLALAALTTPRTYPMVLAFMSAGCVAMMTRGSRDAMAYRFLAAVVAFLGVMLFWTVISHGGPGAWLHYMAYISTHEDTDVALLPTAERNFSFHLSGVLTPGVAVVCGLAAAWSIRKLRGATTPGAAGEAARRAGLSFLLSCVWIDLVVTVAALNYTFTIGEYIALPLFSVIVAWPWGRLVVSRRMAAAGVCALLCLDSLHVALRYVSVAPVWASHDPSRIDAFIARHVPRGSTVVGPDEPFFFAVERNGSRYRVISTRSWADWARWVPVIEPAATAAPRKYPAEPPGERFLLWPDGEDMPDTYRCVERARVATFDAPPPDTRWPAWVLARSLSHADPGYPSAVLYRLPDGCPRGYDPTRPPRVR